MTGALTDVTLNQLATHTSGLPTQLPTPRQIGRNYWASLTAGNPYDGTVRQRLEALGEVPLDAAPRAPTPTSGSGRPAPRWRPRPIVPTGICCGNAS